MKINEIFTREALSPDEDKLIDLQSALTQARSITKGGKYLGSEVIDIMVKIQGLADELGIDESEFNYAEDQVREAQNRLESAIYGLEEPFADAISSLQTKIDDEEMDRQDAEWERERQQADLE